MLADFLRGEKVRVPPELMLARIRRHGRMWGALAVRSPRAELPLGRAPGVLDDRRPGQRADRPDRPRADPRGPRRVDRKILEQSHPKHLAYELLHGIRSLTGYDHSAALLIHDRRLGRAGGRGRADRLAEGQGPERGPQAAALGDAARAAEPALRLRLRPRGQGLDATGPGTDATGLAELLDYDQKPGRGSAPTPPEGAILCASLATRDGLLGILKVASIHPGAFCRYEVELISQFLPQAAVALQNARRAESLEQRVLIAERKHAMADLARGVSHDVNNALGAVLPAGPAAARRARARTTLDPAVAADDLRQIEHSIQVCRRIFGGMVHFARGTARNPSEVSLRQAVDGGAGHLPRGARAAGVRLVVDVPADLPPLFAVQADVEQLLLNLISNARDATGPDDRVTIRADAPADGARAGRRGHRLRDPAGAPGEDPGAVLHDQGQRPRARAGDLPVDRGPAPRPVPDREQPGCGDARPGARSPSRRRRTDDGTEPQGARILVVDDDPGILRAVSRILGRRHHVVCVGVGRGGPRRGADARARPGDRRHPAAGDERLRGHPGAQGGRARTSTRS